MSDGDSNLEVKVVRKLASNKVTGKHKKQISTVQGWGFASHNKGKVGEILEDLARDPEAPVEMYGGRNVVRLTSLEDAKEFIEEHGEDPPWVLQD